MIDIRDVSGSLIVSVPVTEECEHVSELMVSDYVLVSYVSLTAAILPVGAYVIFNGATYRLLAPYEPIRVNEVEYKYEPQFHSKVIAWSGRPFFFLQKTGAVVTGRETDWTLTDILPNFLAAIVDSLLDELGETYTYAWDAGLTGTKSLSFQATSIFDALNEIANAWETEWYLSGTVITFGKCVHGAVVTLTVGTDVSVPEITPSNEGYYSRFYAFGSARNIDQDYDSGSTTNHVVQKRLALPATTCPLGYKDIQAGLPAAQIFTKVLIFEDIYPSSSLAISAVRAELKFAFDGDGNKIQIGVDNLGQPIYERYSIFFFKINGFNFTEDMIVAGKTLSVHFESGNLIGREFELGYNSAMAEYEIIFDESSGYIIPNVVLIPADGDNVIMFNILMPQAYFDAAEAALETAVNAEIAKQSLDMNTYRVNSFPVRFTELGISLSIGRNVSFVNGTSTLATRVLSITEKLDFPVQKVIQIGEKKSFRTTQQLKEAVTNINKNVGVIEALNDLSTTIQNAYGRTQKQIAAALAQWNNMWYFDKSADTSPDQTDFETWIVHSNFDLFIDGNIQAASEITSWVAEAIENGILVNLTATAPLRKSTDSNIVLDYNVAQFELNAGELRIKAGVLAPSDHDHIIADVTGLQTALNNKLETSLKGANSGLAELDATGKVPAAQLPAPASSLELGETLSTAYRGDRGKTAYDHSQATASNPHQTTFAQLVGLPTTLAGYGITDSISLVGHTHLWANITDKPTTFTPASHAHAWADITSGVPSYSLSGHTHSYQPVDTDLSAIAALAGTSGFLKKTAADTWSLDTSTYLTAITKANVEAVLTGSISTHSHLYEGIITKTNGYARWTGSAWEFVNDSYAAYSHTHNFEPVLGNPTVSGYILASTTAGVRSWMAIPPYINDHGALGGLGDDDHTQYYNQTRGDARYSLSGHTHSYQPIDADLTAIAALAGTTGLLRKTLADTWTLDTNSYVTGTPWTAMGYVTGTPWTAMGYLTLQISHGDVLIDGDFTSQGIMVRGASAGVYSITANNSSNWDTGFAHSQTGHQTVISGTGFVKASGTTISFDNSTYITGITKAMIEAQLTGSITTHNHSAAYEPIISKTTGYLRYTGTVWEFKNETYSLSTHNHGTTYEATLGSPATDGWILSSTSLGVRSWIAPAGQSYPSAGIALSSGSGWSASITNNSANWNTAFGWGNHAGLYSLLAHNHSATYQPLDADLTSIAGLAGTSGLLRKTGTDTYVLDTATYLTGITKAQIEAQLTGAITSHTHYYEPSLGVPAVDGYVLSSTVAGVRSWVNGAASSLGHSLNTAAADVAIAAANTWYTGASLSNLSAGTWIIMAHITVLRNGGAAIFSAKICNSAQTVNYASGGVNQATTNQQGTITMAARVILGTTTTINLMATANQIATIKAALLTNPAGNTATQITAIRIG